MPKALTIGNGDMLLCFDRNAYLRDLYFPYVGLENHIGEHVTHRFGVWVDDTLRWLSHDSWKLFVDCERDTLAGSITAYNDELDISLHIRDVVYNERPIYVRKVTVTNHADYAREIKLFFNQEFELYASHSANTAYFDPNEHAVIHYRGRRSFLVNAIDDAGTLFDEFTTGVYGIEGKEGSFRDAEDGILSGNPIEHGPADSIIGVSLSVDARADRTVYYWMTVGKGIQDTIAHNTYVRQKGPEHLVRTTTDYWRAWIRKRAFNFHGLSDGVISIFQKSQLLVRSHADNRGAIIASGDSDMLQKGKDTYSYMWPRDAAFTALALDGVGDSNVSNRFFAFCNSIIHEEGYFMHKYGPDGALGSSWHPWYRNGHAQLPIQEDETAIVLIALWRHYSHTKDIEFIERIYNSLIRPAARFMVRYRDESTGLPLPSYDLWEEKWGIHTYTAAAVYGALIAAARFAELLGKDRQAKEYRRPAQKMKSAIIERLFDQENGVFCKRIVTDGDTLGDIDNTVDISSVYGMFAFGLLEPTDPKIVSSMEMVEDRLVLPTDIGGVARYEDDGYYRVSTDVPGNPWFVTTMWLAQYYALRAESESDLESVKGKLDWAVRYALPSGVLSEQLDPYTGTQISAAPLTWSHSEFIRTVLAYLHKLEELGVCKTCDIDAPESVL